MHPLDGVVLAAYFLLMIGIGVYCARRVKVQEDFFMGGRGFGKLLQTFAAFGAGTGSSDPVNVGRTTFTSGMSGMWSVMYWLFVTPFYWIAAVWYRRMRHLTLGDWFVERYECRPLGAAYAVFGLWFHIVYGSMLFAAIGKVAAPLINIDAVSIGGETFGIELILVPIIGFVVLVYGIMGGLRAAYFTDLIQGICIILLSIILIPYGLEALVDKFGGGEGGLLRGFEIMHEQIPKEYFTVVGSSASSEFPWYYILAIVVINLIGVVVQPHFIATGGGSAKTEMTARVGLVIGNFLKRFCTVGWVLTSLIALALLADSPELAADPDKTWGIASRELLGPGLTGLMLACLLAALMSSVDAYMVVGSGLVVRNIYAPFINSNATEAQYVMVARVTGVFLVAGSVVVALVYNDVFTQLKLTWIVNVVFATPFWIGLFWRRATCHAAWLTVGFCACTFFFLPLLVPTFYPALRENPDYLTMNAVVVRTTERVAAPADVARRDAAIAIWPERVAKAEKIEDATQRAKKLAAIGALTEKIAVGDKLRESSTTGGQSVFWSEGVTPIDSEGKELKDVKRQPVGEPREVDGVTEVVLRYPDDVRLKGKGSFQLDFLVYRWCGMDFTTKSKQMLNMLDLALKIVTPFLVMILLSLVTRRNSKDALDRYYAKMKTPVDPDPEVDRQNLEAAYANLEQFEEKKLFPGTSFEFEKPSRLDVVGFALSVLACFGIIGLAVLVVSIGT